MPQGLDRELVLIAEDDIANQALLGRLLERAGYRSFAVGDGREALRAAIQDKPDLVLLDIGLPGLDGLDVCRRLRAEPSTVALPVILVTGQTSSRDVVAGLDAGADDFVRKPYDEAELMARVRSVLRLARVTAEVVGARGVIAALANAVEAKDATTEMHCQRLAGLAHRLGMRAGLEPQELKGLVFGALLHDIGKIGVSDAVLTKPAALTAREWHEMRQHPLIGERICEPLASAAQFAPIIRSHHERWDGEGYPDRLRGEQIPLGARIVGLVDAYDAMIHDRPYRRARTVDMAIAEINGLAGIQFDPDLARMFVEIVQREGDEARTAGVRALAALRAAV
jgi:putative two-component system response regulator